MVMTGLSTEIMDVFERARTIAHDDLGADVSDLEIAMGKHLDYDERGSRIIIPAEGLDHPEYHIGLVVGSHAAGKLNPAIGRNKLPLYSATIQRGFSEFFAVDLMEQESCLFDWSDIPMALTSLVMFPKRQFTRKGAEFFREVNKEFGLDYVASIMQEMPIQPYEFFNPAYHIRKVSGETSWPERISRDFLFKSGQCVRGGVVGMTGLVMAGAGIAGGYLNGFDLLEQTASFAQLPSEMMHPYLMPTAAGPLMYEAAHSVGFAALVIASFPLLLDAVGRIDSVMSKYRIDSVRNKYLAINAANNGVAEQPTSS